MVDALVPRSPPGGMRDFHGRRERSRSREDLLEVRGQRFGRGGRDTKDGYNSNLLPEGKTRTDRRGDSGRPGGKDQEMMRHGGGGGGYDRRPYEDQGSGSYRESGGYRERGGGDRGDYGGRGGHGGHGGGGKFGSAKTSTVTQGQSSQMWSNHFRFSHRTQDKHRVISIYMIDFGVLQDHREARFQALRSVDNDLKRILGLYLFYGRSIFSTTRVDDFTLNASCEGQVGELQFKLSNSFSLDDYQQAQINFTIQDRGKVLDFMNKIVKRSLYEQDYKEYGRLPKFFNSSQKKDLPHFELIVWPGYTCQVKSLHDGIFLNVDTSTKFLEQRTVLDIIQDMFKQRFSQKEITEQLCPKWDDSKSSISGQSDTDARRLVVITSYNTQSYQIEEIEWDQTPESQQFTYKEKDPNTNIVKPSKINLKQYMEIRWNVQLAPWELRQPLLKLTVRGDPVYLIPSRCHKASLPADFTQDSNKMRNLREHMASEPRERLGRIASLIESFAKADMLGEWHLKVTENFAHVRAKQLYSAQIFNPRANSFCEWSDQSKRYAHVQPLHLLANQWAVLYGSRDHGLANDLFYKMQEASNMFGIRVEEPQWVEVPQGDDFCNAIRADVNPKVCKIVVAIIHDGKQKQKIKKFLDQGAVPSQFIKTQTVQKGMRSITVFSNLLKQMNAKLRLDLHRLSLPCCANTLLVGIDVIMSGRNKLIGCCSTVNKELTQCYTKLYKQKHPKVPEGAIPGVNLREELEKEITRERTLIIKRFIDEAVGVYYQANQTLPNQIIIYRDGMGGPSLTARVQEIEVQEITALLETKAQGYKPMIMYCLVDRNIQHRIFAKNHDEWVNPGSGTVVDAALVENQGSQIFDFFLVPHNATVATAQPVLFKSVYNTTRMTKDEFETTTYHLCFNYFNFAGPIKVPMVCMYAHKIAFYAQENKLMPNEGLSRFLHFL